VHGSPDVGRYQGKRYVSLTYHLDARLSHDSDIQNTDAEERSRYLSEVEEAEKSGSVKKGSWLNRLIAQGNKRMENQLRAEQEKGKRKDGVIH
jgi:hypothetical protein